MSCILLHLFARCLSLPPLRHSFPVDPEVPTDQESYPSDDQFATAELPGKQPHFDHTDITHSLPLLFLH